MNNKRSVTSRGITTNEELAEMEKQSANGDATAQVRSNHIVELNSKVADKVKALTPQVKAALKIENDDTAALTARLLLIENPGVL